VANVWVKAITINYITNEHAEMETKHPGDWFQLPKGAARQRVATGQVEICNPATLNLVIPPESGIVCIGAQPDIQTTLEIKSGDPQLAFERTLIWDPQIFLNTKLLPAAFSLLDKFEVLVPITDYNRLAKEYGTAAEREKTAALIPDLRVPVYEPGMMFLRRAIATEQLIDLYLSDLQAGGDPHLSLLRALWEVKPYILALPTIWVEQ